MDHAPAALDVALGGEAAAPLTGALERGKGLRETVAGLWDTSFDTTEAPTQRGQNGRPVYPVGRPARGVMAGPTIESRLILPVERPDGDVGDENAIAAGVAPCVTA